MLKNRVLASFGALFACGAAVAVYFEKYIPLFLLLVAGVLCGYFCIARLLRRKPRIRRTLAYAACAALGYRLHARLPRAVHYALLCA